VMSRERDLDVVVFGATGFVGRLVAEYLAAHSPDGVRIGLAGRSEPKLAALAGELLFMRDSVDRYHDAAVKKGVRIVHSCGFDSIPSDLGVMLLHQQALADRTGELEGTTLVEKGGEGALSGGTLASGMLQMDETRANPEYRRIVNDPYALGPDRAEEPDLGDERDLAWIQLDDDLETWTGPFVMAGVNTRNVRRSNSLQSWAYGRRFRYREVTDFGHGVAGASKAAAMSVGRAAVAAGAGVGPARGAAGPGV